MLVRQGTRTRQRVGQKIDPSIDSTEAIVKQVDQAKYYRLYALSQA
jgi:hypothetical protein